MTEPPPDDYRERQRTNRLVIAIVVALVAAMVVLMLSLQRGIRRENCLAASHRNCVPIEQQL